MGELGNKTQKPFAVFDIDGTLIRWQLYHAVVNQLIKQGNLSKTAHQQIHDARMTWKNRQHHESFSDYEKVLVNVYHNALADLDVNDFNRAIDAVFNEYKDQVYTYTRDLIQELKDKGYVLLAISGSYQEIVTRLAKHYGFDDAIGQVYEQHNGYFTGEHTKPMHHKNKVLQELADKHGLTFEDSVAIGDSNGDISMLEVVQHPIAFNPNKKLFQHAKEQGWKIVVERKNMVYELENKNGAYQLA